MGIELKLDDFPKSVEQLASLCCQFLIIDSGATWTFEYEIEHWDAKIIFRQGDFVNQLDYDPSRGILYLFANVDMVLHNWKRAQVKNKVV